MKAMRFDTRSIAAAVLLTAAAGAVYADQPQAPSSAVQQRLNMLEKMTVTEQKQPTADAPVANAQVQKVLADAAAAERNAPAVKR